MNPALAAAAAARPGGSSRFSSVRYFAALCALAFLVFFAGLGKKDFWSPDEPRVAGVLAYMARSGDYVVPTLNGHPFLEQPPLHSWIGAASLKIFGENAFGARFPSALAAFLTALLVFHLGRRMGFSPASCFLSCMVLITSVQFFDLGRRCLIDMTLCFFVTLALVAYHHAFHAARPWPRRVFGALFAAALAGGVMSKGLVGLAVPLAALCGWLLVTRNFSFKTWLGLALGAVVSLVPTAIWLLYLNQRLGSAAVYEVVWANNFGRFTGSHQSHVNPFYYYLYTFPSQFLPWSLFIPLVIGRFVMTRREKDPSGRPASLFLAAWFVFPFLLLSASAGKRGLYALPIYPPAALLVGTSLTWALERAAAVPRILFRIPLALLLGVSVLLSLALFGASIYFKAPVLVWVICLVPGIAAGLLGFRRLRRGSAEGALAWFAMGMAGLLVVAGIWVYPLGDALKSYDPLLQYAEECEARGAQVGLFQPPEALEGIMFFHLNRVCPSFWGEKELNDFLESDDKALAVARKENLDVLKRVEVLREFSIGSKNYLVLKWRGRDAPPS